MKLSFLEKSFITILIVIFAGIVVHAPLSVWLGSLFPDQAFLIKAWKEVLIATASLLVAIVVTKRRLWTELVRDPLFLAIVAYSIIHLVLVGALYQGALPSLAGLAIDLRYIVFFSLVYIAVRLFPRSRSIFLQIVAIGAAVVVGFATLQLFLPIDILMYIGYGKDTIMPYLTVDMNYDFVRFNSTLRGPNPLGAYAVICIGVFAALVTRGVIDLKNKKVAFYGSVFALCTIIALWVTYSRSAFVAAVIALFIVLVMTVAKRIPARIWIAGCILLGAITGGLIAGRDSSFVSNVLLHENPQGGSSITSNDQHVESLAYGFDRMIHQPFGAGVGSTGSASLYGEDGLIIENQYLFVAHEAGWLGLLLFLCIFGLIMYRLWQNKRDWLSLGVFASGVGLALVGLIQPVWVDDTVSIIWWGLAAIALAGKVTYGRKKSK